MNEYLYHIYDKQGNYIDTGYIENYGKEDFILNKVKNYFGVIGIEQKGYKFKDVILCKVEHKHKIEILGD